MIANAGAQRDEIVIAGGIRHDQALAAAGGFGECGPDRGCPGPYRGVRQMADLQRRLALQPATDVRVGHRGQRMALHAGFRQQPVMHEEVALIERAARAGEGGTDQRQGGVEHGENRLRDGADIA